MFVRKYIFEKLYSSEELYWLDDLFEEDDDDDGSDVFKDEEFKELREDESFEENANSNV